MEYVWNLTGTKPPYQAVYNWIIDDASSASIANASTIGYYYCRNGMSYDPLDQTWPTNPGNCPPGYIGYNTVTQTWGYEQPAYHLLPAENSQNAKLIYFHQGPCQ